MISKPGFPLPDFPALRLINSERAWPLALCLSLALHMIILLPPSMFISRPKITPGALMEVHLVAPQTSPQPPAKPDKIPDKPEFKEKIKTKIRKKPAALQKPKITPKESPLARRPSVPVKKAPPIQEKLDEIKARLEQQREAEKLNEIRQRLHQELSPAAQARQASLTQTYQMQLKAWLMRNWHLPEHLLNSGLVSIVSLTIDASGKLLKQQEEKLSGNPIFDNAMRQAVINACPFPPFPTELDLSREEFVITFDPNDLKK
ncbi:MAG: TonB C-terminal domain-containing protein [Deltaproteobacteria bacterium]|nr:TonB C-terminal domain-containing protein [Deltaproteobacteria bacterium]